MFADLLPTLLPAILACSFPEQDRIARVDRSGLIRRMHELHAANYEAGQTACGARDATTWTGALDRVYATARELAALGLPHVDARGQRISITIEGGGAVFQVGGKTIDFVIFPWNEVKEREEDGQTNIWEYFIGFDGPAFEKVESGEWTPLGAGNMDAGALKYDGGFQESGHRGMLFANEGGDLFFYDHNSGREPVALKTRLSELG